MTNWTAKIIPRCGILAKDSVNFLRFLQEIFEKGLFRRIVEKQGGPGGFFASGPPKQKQNPRLQCLVILSPELNQKHVYKIKNQI